MQGDGQAEGTPAIYHLYIGNNSGYKNKIEVTGARFLRGVAKCVDCDGKYKKLQ